jgi:hypothetical protein
MSWTCIKMQRIIYSVGMKIVLEGNDTQFTTTNSEKREYNSLENFACVSGRGTLPRAHLAFS